MRLCSFVFLLLVLASGVAAQPADSIPPPDTLKVADTVVAKDSALKPDTLLFVPRPDTSALAQLTSPTDLETHLTQPPTLALFKSMLVPGWGQVGNKKYFKAGVFIGLEGWFLSKALHYGSQTSDLKRQFNEATDLSTRNSLHATYESRRGQRNKFYWFFGLTTFVSMFDAYVDAHLSGSPTDKRNHRLSLDVAPDPRGGGQVKLALSLH